MKSLKLYSVCLSFLVLPSIILAQNLEKYNLSFDNFDSINQAMPNGWGKWGFFKDVTGEKLEENNYAGKVASDGNGKFGVIVYKIPANYIGDTISLTGRIKHEDVKGYVGLLMRIESNIRNTLGFENMSKFEIQGTEDWKEYAIKLPLPSTAESIFVGGILGGKGVAWFDDFKVTIDGKDIETLKETPKIYLQDFNTDKFNTALGKSSTPIDLSTKAVLSSSLDPLIENLADKRIVAIGESTHGTSEFYYLREIITKRLIEEKGFNLVVLESPYDDIELLKKELSERPLDSLMKKHLFSIYQTQEMKSVLQWYKDNRLRYDIKFKGCDDSYWVFYELLNDKLGVTNDKILNKLLAELKSNIAKSDTDNRKKEYKLKVSIYNNILSIEKQLKSNNNLTEPLKEILFNGKSSYINYINISNKKPIQSRDEIMADRISYLAKNKNIKIIVWAHNAHISNKIITNNEIGIMGRDLKLEFGNDYHSIGLTTLNGSYSFIDEKFINIDHFYDEGLKKANIQSTETYLWENSLAINGNAFYLDFSTFQKELKTNVIIGSTRFIGYGKETEKDIYQLQLTKNFDSLIFIKNTSATTPLSD
jgi:erythromycin esterase-like protein